MSQSMEITLEEVAASIQKVQGEYKLYALAYKPVLEEHPALRIWAAQLC